MQIRSLNCPKDTSLQIGTNQLSTSQPSVGTGLKYTQYARDTCKCHVKYIHKQSV